MTDRMREVMEEVREKTLARTGEYEMLDFYPAGIEMGLSEYEAGKLDEILTARVMRARGAI